MVNFFLFVFLSCVKQSQDIHLQYRRIFFEVEDCLAVLKENMTAADCPLLSVTNATEVDVMIRCKKPDVERGEFWDNYIFRISPADVQYSTDEDISLIDTHTVCVDAGMRIEAYPPNDYGEK